MSNLDIWEKVEKVDQSATRPFQRGGFTGTAISPSWMAKMATEMFGPCGIGWGYEVIDEKYVETLPVMKDGVVIGREMTHVIRVRLWYLQGSQKGMVEHYGQTAMVGMKSGIYFSDEDAPKKSLTDAIGKCLSMLGFGAEIYSGLNDSKYSEGGLVSAPTSKESGNEKAGFSSGLAGMGGSDKNLKCSLEASKKRLAECNSEKIATARVMASQMFEGKDLDDFLKAISLREAELALTAT